MSSNVFHGTIRLEYQRDNSRTTIDQARISYLMINYDYSKVIPMVFLSAAISYDMYNDMINYQKTAKMFIDVQGYNIYSTNSTSKRSISGTFRYVLSDTNQTKSSTSGDASYITVTMGLVSDDMINKMRIPFNGIYRDISTSNVIAMALKDTNVCLEPIKYQHNYKQLVIPAVNSRYKLLEYIFNKDPFYDTSFKYFMDFDRSYLLSQSGRGFKLNDGKPIDIILDIQNTRTSEAMSYGYQIRNGSYYIYVNQMDTNITINNAKDKVIDKIVAYDTEIEQPVNYDLNSADGDKTLFIRSKSGNLIKNDLDSTDVIVEILKQGMDDSIFQLNKHISIKMYGEYEAYSGTYLMIYKKVFYKHAGNEFIVSVNIGLKLISDIEARNAPENTTNKKSKASSTYATKSSTNSDKYVRYNTVSRSEYNKQ
jgi:hypothetical protein